MSSKKPEEKIKTTILLTKSIKKLAQIYALQHDTTLGDVIEQALKEKIID